WMRMWMHTIAKCVLLALLLAWLFIETAASAPHFLSYFNELGGGAAHGYRHVTDSNYDWGQDLLRLKEWADKNPQADKIAVDYFGGANPQYYLGDKNTYWQSSYGDPRAAGIHWL